MKTLHGKIVLVDDEKYEKELLQLALHKKHWHAQVEYFPSAETAMEYLKETKDHIFILICDMNMPGMNGLEFKKRIDRDPQLRRKAIPFVFLSTAAMRNQVEEAYDYRVQGFFRKPLTVDEQAEKLDLIIRYWLESRNPNLEN